jgi:hypothetical protein
MRQSEIGSIDEQRISAIAFKNEFFFPKQEAKVIFKSDGATSCLHNDGLTSDYPII